MTDAVLVCEAQAIGMIGVIRSLGRAGYRVHAASASANALGFLSKYAFRPVQHPAYDSSAFLPWLDSYLSEHTIAAIVPSEAFLLAVKPHYARYARWFPDAVSETVLYRNFSKCDVEERLQRHTSLLKTMPRARVVHRGVPAAANVDGFNWPLYVKTDGLHADKNSDATVRAARDLHELRARIKEALGTHSRCMVQESVPGVKATVNVWRRKGEIMALSMCVAMHESPHTGGLTAYRKVWWHEAMCEDAKARLAALQWEGVAMVEYKWDAATGKFWFIELNARYWNALNLDLLSDKDFPRWQLDAFLRDIEHRSLEPGKVGFRARYTVPADIGHTLSKIRDSNVTLGAKLWSAVEFGLLALNPAVHSDLWFPGDRGLYWQGWWRFISRLGRA